jgi:hypothetical protein
MLTVIEAAKNRDLTLTATVKAEMGITIRDDDQQIKRLIGQASDVVATYCNRVFATETVAETLRSFGRSASFMLSRYPVIEVVSVIEAGVSLTADQYEIDLRTGIIDRISASCISPWGHGKTVVTYKSGFALPSDLPDGVERATILLVKQYLASGDRDPMVRSESVEGAGSTDYFSGAGTGLPPEVQGLLERHVNPNG